MKRNTHNAIICLLAGSVYTYIVIIWIINTIRSDMTMLEYLDYNPSIAVLGLISLIIHYTFRYKVFHWSDKDENK